MALSAIIVFGIGAALYGLVIPAKWRGYILLIGSIVAIYWLQPALPIQPVDFVLPTGTLILAVIGWLLTRQETDISGDNALTLGIMAISVIVLAAFGGMLRLTPSQPPPVLDVFVALVGVAVGIAALASMVQDRQKVIPWFIVLILVIFVVLKNDTLSQTVSTWFRSQENRPLFLAQASDLQWLGFSYVSFRLIHTLRDRQTGRLPPLTLREYLTYLIFFPAYTAGPIDRAERFVKDYRALPNFDAPRSMEGVSRIVIGLFKKFII